VSISESLKSQKTALRTALIAAFALYVLAAVTCCAQGNFQQEADRLATLLNWHPGSIVAEIGAGRGQLTVAAAERVGPSGKVYTTELDPKDFAHLQELAADTKNITAIKAGETDTNLPPACCDVIFMRLVYHHLTRPAQIDASLFSALKAEGRLGVIDEDPPPGSSIPEGVPTNRGGHGIPQKILISELTAAGFKVETVQNDWPSHDDYHHVYCVVFRKAKR
jgi:predicted methyltransferase